MKKNCQFKPKNIACEKRDRIKVSLICTIKNEETSIDRFLETIISQSRSPDEIVIVDGGSTDKTIQIIDSHIKKGAPIKLIIKNGANISEGRNTAIKNAKYDIIASTDAGCKIEKDWLNNLIEPFEKNQNVDVVSGGYKSFGKTNFEKCFAELNNRGIELWTSENFLPSSRSIAYKKDAWKKVNGYPEYLDIAEDTAFDLNLKKAGCKFVIAKDALVYWRMRKDFRSLFRQHYNYAKWDAVAGIGGHKSRCIITFLYFILAGFLMVISYHSVYLGLSLFIAFLLYTLLRYGFPLYLKLNKPSCFYFGPASMLTITLANALGIIVGKFKK